MVIEEQAIVMVFRDGMMGSSLDFVIGVFEVSVIS